VGKTTVAFEVCRQLEAADVPHAMVDTDELDRVYPAPADDPHKSLLTSRNLAVVWENLRGAGARRLVLTMVALSLENELPWIKEAVPGAQITAVRLVSSEEELLERIRGREIGSGAEDQMSRSVERLRVMQRKPGNAAVVETTGRTVTEIAREVLSRCGWTV
jgi:hypothetical protein